MMRARAFSLLAWMAIALAGCPALLQDFTIGAGSDAGDEGTVDSGSGAGDGGTVDAAACLAQQVDTQNGVFVLASGSDGGACGAIDMPCATVQMGIGRAQNLGKALVYVAAGTYVESITLHAGITVEGGWRARGSTWTPDCTSGVDGAVVIQAPPSANKTVLANNLAGTATMRRLTIKSKGQTDVQPGESLYGVFASDPSTTLELDDVPVQLVAAGDGAGGSTGTAGAPAASGCVTATAGSGGQGNDGGPGVASDGGTFSEGGFVPGDGLGAGGIAGVGNAGTAGSPACANNQKTCSLPAGSQCGDPCSQSGASMVCATGTSGCGGNPGSGGTPATGGGSSIAIYCWNAMVTVSDGALAPGNGGTGGAGGAGGGGGAGSQGRPASMSYGCGCGGGCCATAQCSVMAGAGGAGGTGGTGGQGGGGAGGWSCAYYVGGTGNVTLDATPLTLGMPGVGGQAGGAAGLAKGKCP